jgi:hypothetical protein
MTTVTSTPTPVVPSPMSVSAFVSPPQATSPPPNAMTMSTSAAPARANSKKVDKADKGV